ncbi:hypothetical protein JOF29_004854 [Kribbella aluminosa]|uniref:Bacterial CdiA-CT RNAse A domain-containing protein n=1 Tax=Kribbella aluminosa TaxID=416017 RepID=A0ABS4UQ65_9ACTN|nr:hypothetical protein [Kribbella aluminosa]MBP2353744.1 hypothetical protein [Kribbella aluminosa]
MRRDPIFTRDGWGIDAPPSRPNDSPQEEPEPQPDSDEPDSPDQNDEESPDKPASSDDSGQIRRFALDAEIDGEPVRSRFDHWDPERLAMPRPPKPDTPAPSDRRPEVGDRRAEDERNGVAYIAARQEARPWLAPAANCEPIVQSVYASIDQSKGHGHIRHGAMGSDELQARRVAFNEDPAQADPDQRAAGVDGLDDSKQHYCGKDSTRVNDATALAAIYVMASEHPKVRAILDQPFDNNMQPRDIVVPIVELLGPNGHEVCSGFTLKGWPEAKVARKEWLEAKRSGADVSDVPSPEVERIPTFEGGDIKIVFKRNPETQSYGIYTLFPRPFDE